MADRRRPQRLGLGILFLAYKLHEFGLRYIPPVTLVFIIFQALLFTGVIRPPWNYHDVCISGYAILYHQDYRRLILSALEHADDFHLYHNMASFLLKGKSLEQRYGSKKFLILLLVFIFSTSAAYVGLAVLATIVFEDHSYMQSCAVGFSGIIFALKVLTTYHRHNIQENVFGFWVPTKYAVWVELGVIDILTPNSSFMGHLAGILVGLLYIKGPLKFVVNSIDNMINLLIGNSGYYEEREYYTQRPFSGQGRSFSNSQYEEDSTFNYEEIRRRNQRFF